MLTLQGCSTTLGTVYLAKSFGLGKPDGGGRGGGSVPAPFWTHAELALSACGHVQSWPCQPDSGQVTYRVSFLNLSVLIYLLQNTPEKNYLRKEGLRCPLSWKERLSQEQEQEGAARVSIDGRQREMDAGAQIPFLSVQSGTLA